MAEFAANLDAAIRTRLAEFDASMDATGSLCGAEEMHAALTAVLDLHGADEAGFCQECSDEFPAAHPCQTVRAIAKALGVEAS